MHLEPRAKVQSMTKIEEIAHLPSTRCSVEKQSVCGEPSVLPDT